MRFLVLFVVSIILLGCADDDVDTSNIIGMWRLDQVLVDPRDGSGIFSDVESNKTIDFFVNGTYVSNGDLCNMFSVEQFASSGTFSSEKRIIYPTDCDTNFGDGSLKYSIENGALTIYYQCIEACAEKYVKIA